MRPAAGAARGDRQRHARLLRQAVLDVDATLAQLQATENARRTVTEQRKEAEREELRLSGERERVERDYRAGSLPADRYAFLDAKIAVEQRAATAQADRLRERERELSAENLVAAIDAETAEALNGIRTAIVEHVRGAHDLDAIRAALLATFEGFTFRDGRIEPQPRLEALRGFVAHPTGSQPWDQVEHEPLLKRIPLTTRANYYSSSSPSQ